MTDTTRLEEPKKSEKPSRWTTLNTILGSLTALFALATALLGFLAATSKQAAEDATNEATDLSVQVQELEQANAELTEDVAALNKENEQLRAQTGEGEGADDLVIETVRVEAGDFKQVAPWEYELAGSRTLDFRFYWTTIANTGRLEGTDCIVVATVTDLADDSTFDVHRTQTCSLTGWVGEELPAGEYRITVEVEAVTGAKGVGEATAKVLP